MWFESRMGLIMTYNSIHINDYLWYLIFCEKQKERTKKHPNTKFLHSFQTVWTTLIKTRFQKISNSIYGNFLKCIIYSYYGSMLSNLIHVKLCVLFLYLVSLLMHRIGILLAYVAALFVTSVFQLLFVWGWEGRVWDSKSRGRRFEYDTYPNFTHSRLISIFYFFIL